MQGRFLALFSAVCCVIPQHVTRSCGRRAPCGSFVLYSLGTPLIAHTGSVNSTPLAYAISNIHICEYRSYVAHRKPCECETYWLNQELLIFQWFLTTVCLIYYWAVDSSKKRLSMDECPHLDVFLRYYCHSRLSPD